MNVRSITVVIVACSLFISSLHGVPLAPDILAKLNSEYLLTLQKHFIDVVGLVEQSGSALYDRDYVAQTYVIHDVINGGPDECPHDPFNGYTFDEGQWVWLSNGGGEWVWIMRDDLAFIKHILYGTPYQP